MLLSTYTDRNYLVILSTAPLFSLDFCNMEPDTRTNRMLEMPKAATPKISKGTYCLTISVCVQSLGFSFCA